ncbi:MAG TPA: hypothetical protein VM639_12485 [Dongiaceae bacterium]|nr:hypothetical protein [Dongiaceae bacterium]
MHRYWRKLAGQAFGEADLSSRAAGGLSPAAPAVLPPPPRHLLDPAAIVDLLPHVLLAEFETAPFRVRYRLTGTRIDEASGLNLTGTYLDEIDGGASLAIFGPMIENYRHCWQTGEAVIDFYEWTTQNGRKMVICYGLFPLTIDGEIRQAIAIEEYDPSQDLDPLVPLHHR